MSTFSEIKTVQQAITTWFETKAVADAEELAFKVAEAEAILAVVKDCEGKKTNEAERAAMVTLKVKDARAARDRAARVADAHYHLMLSMRDARSFDKAA